MNERKRKGFTNLNSNEKIIKEPCVSLARKYFSRSLLQFLVNIAINRVREPEVRMDGMRAQQPFGEWANRENRYDCVLEDLPSKLDETYRLAKSLSDFYRS